MPNPKLAYCTTLLTAIFMLNVVIGQDNSNVGSTSLQSQKPSPQGKLSNGTFTESKIFPGTKRDYSVYVPAEYDASKPACLMVFQDGLTYSKLDGAFRIPLVFDELIRKKEMPVTIAVFVTPGTITGVTPEAKDRSIRSFEYDSLGDRYAKFLLDEFLPVALKDLNVSTDPKQRALCGISSGGVCAFTAAWERPEQFGKVLSHIGSYTNIRGGWAYPGLIRKSKNKPKAIKVFLQEGKDDLNNLFGNWPLANEDMAAALKFSGYEHKFVMTGGGHSGVEGGKIIAESLRWLWSDQVDSKQATAPEPAAPVATEKKKWEPHSDAIAREDVPHGVVEQMPTLESKIFANTARDWAVYVPAQYKKEVPAALMVFQDGHGYQNVKGQWRVPVVFDNLIASGEMPPTIAVFINPGYDLAKGKPKSPWEASNRSLEYDSLGDRYARFLHEEILPEVEKKYSISKDPGMRAICGSSSGAICAFTVAWERPDSFGKVLSTIGSFVHLRGGNVYPSLIRKTEPKPIRVYLADTSGDLDNPFGHWPLANKQMSSALQYMGYDVRFDWEEGYGHNAEHGGKLFPDAIRWLWRKAKHQPQYDTKGDLKGDLTLLNLLIPGQGWEVVAENLGFADAPCTDAEGNFYYSDMKAPAVYKISAADGSKTEIAKEALSGMKFGPNGLLYGCQGSKSRIVSIDVKAGPKQGSVQEVATSVSPNDLAISSNGFIYITETKEKQITRVTIASGAIQVVDTGIERPNGIAISNDGGTLAVSEYGGSNVWTFRVNADGSLDAKMPTMMLRQPVDTNGKFDFNEPPPYKAAASGDGMAVDRIGRYYVTSALGIQIFDPSGRQCGVLPKPKESAPLTSCVLAGAAFDYLYVTNGETIYKRKLTIE